MEEEFEPTNLSGPVETIGEFEADGDAEITGGQSGFIIIIRSFPQCLRRGLPSFSMVQDGSARSVPMKHSAGREHSGQDLEEA
jgi:hypothetical protein